MVQETTAAVTRADVNLHYQGVVSYVMPVAAFATRIKMESSQSRDQGDL